MRQSGQLISRNQDRNDGGERNEHNERRPVIIEQDAEMYLTNVIREIVQTKQKTKAWGTFTVDLHWKDGKLDMAEMTDSTKVKFSAVS